MVQEVAEKSEFDALIAKTPCVVVDYTATWCRPCQQMAPTFAELDAEIDGVKFLKVDVDDAEEIAEAMDIKAMPAFHFFQGGKKVGESLGAISKENLRAKIEELQTPPENHSNDDKWISK